MTTWMKDQSKESDQSANPKWEAWRAFQDDFCKRVLRQQAFWLRDIIGNPFRPVAANPAWLAWNDEAIPKMAQAIYDERAFARLPLLADALEDAGCTEAEILAHSRGPGPHVRGCWVVDLLLGKK